MATMLNGEAIMGGALLLIAANESCPQPQTSEQLAAVEILQLQHIIIVQNKVDLAPENVAINQHEEIQTFIQGTGAEGAPVVSEYIVKKHTSPPNMIVIWSFDVNKLAKVDEIRGGVSWWKYSRGCFEGKSNH